jgi:hypothetical protein
LIARITSSGDVWSVKAGVDCAFTLLLLLLLLRVLLLMPFFALEPFEDPALVAAALGDLDEADFCCFFSRSRAFRSGLDNSVFFITTLPSALLLARSAITALDFACCTVELVMLDLSLFPPP